MRLKKLPLGRSVAIGAIHLDQPVMNMKYRVVLKESDEGFSVYCPGLPGCWSQGASEPEALDNIRIAIEEYLSVVEDLTRGEEVRVVEVAA
jgi:predicted RNase H-like HicB family nuclease